jgi:hypothetical protein
MEKKRKKDVSKQLLAAVSGGIKFTRNFKTDTGVPFVKSNNGPKYTGSGRGNSTITAPQGYTEARNSTTGAAPVSINRRNPFSYTQPGVSPPADHGYTSSSAPAIPSENPPTYGAHTGDTQIG